MLLIIFRDTRKPLERRSWTHSNETSSISRSKGFLPAPSSRFRLQLADSNLLWFARQLSHSLPVYVELLRCFIVTIAFNGKPYGF